MNFIRRYAIWIMAWAMIATGAATYYVLKPAAQVELAGLRYEISLRSGQEIRTILQESPITTAAFVIKYKFDEGESPIIWYWAKSENRDEVDDLMLRMQAQYREKNKSSDDYSEQDIANPFSLLKFSSEVKNGLIRCGALTPDVLVENPTVKQFSDGICFVTIPPFENKTFLALMVLTKPALVEGSPEMLAFRKLLLQLQIDVFNRDFMGTETWPHP